MAKITLTKALILVKHYRKELENLNSAIFVDHVLATAEDKSSDIRKSTQANWDKLNQVAENLSKVQSAIRKANSQVEVTIAGKKLTILDALMLKEQYENTLPIFQKAQMQWRAALKKQEDSVAKIEKEVANDLNRLDTAAATEDKEKMRAMLHESYSKGVLVAICSGIPTKKDVTVGDVISAKIEEITQFLDEIDIVLSEANVLNHIDVDI